MVENSSLGTLIFKNDMSLALENLNFSTLILSAFVLSGIEDNTTDDCFLLYFI